MPPLSVAPDAPTYLSQVRLTVPEGAGLPLPPLTAIVTDREGSAVVMVAGEGVTLTVGVIGVAAVTVIATKFCEELL